MIRTFLLLVIITNITACSSGGKMFSATKKYPPEILQKDYKIYRNILEEAHPGLYWYTSHDSMNYYFDWGFNQLKDSLTEPEFRRVLAFVTAKIRCGHTSVRASRNYSRYQDTARIPRVFPLSLKLWDDTAVVSANLNRRDSALRRGTIITGINGVPIKTIVDTLMNFVVTDGYNTTHKYQALSNRGYFGALYSGVFGFSNTYKINYIDSAGKNGITTIKPFIPPPDTISKSLVSPVNRPPKPSRRDRKNMDLDATRLLKVDTATNVAMMDLSSFAKGYGLRKFFRHSFKKLRQHHINDLIIDVRGNGGGSVTNSTMITRLLVDSSFKVADTLYAPRRRKTYSRYIKNDFFNRLFITFLTHKKKDGMHHFAYFERHSFKPKKKNHFYGNTYILIGGNSFSATTLFVDALIKQDNVTIIGEETGGGAYGNSAWLIPEVTLPETKVGFRLPLFRLVIDKNIPKTGRGVMPEISSVPTVDAIRKGIDYKLQVALDLIDKKKKIK